MKEEREQGSDVTTVTELHIYGYIRSSQATKKIPCALCVDPVDPTAAVDLRV
jgi:hypothetical protein